MAVFTELQHADADRVARAHGLGAARGVEPIAAGSVNSNYFVDTDHGRRFLRIYEEQEAEGVRYEWAVIDRLVEAGFPVPRRVPGPEPGALRVAGKPVAIFELVGGEPSCQAAVTPARAAAVGRMLAAIHRALGQFEWSRAGRFTLDSIRRRLGEIKTDTNVELATTISYLIQIADRVRDALSPELPRGVIHGDLFRDNVRWEADRIVAVIDWESASEGAFVYDLMVTVLAWCYGDDFDWELARALVGAYHAARPLTEREQATLHDAALAGCVRFATTRITDFQLSGSLGDRVTKDYRRFTQRLETLDAMTPQQLTTRLLGCSSSPQPR